MDRGEKFNTLTHLYALLFAVLGVIYLNVQTLKTGDSWKIVSIAIYSTTLLLLYLSSTIYHSHSSRYKNLFRKLDHLSIYLLIAGTYTPFMLVTLRGAWGWSILGVVWGLAFAGMMLDILSTQPEKEDKRMLQLFIYLLMGWLIIIPLKPLAENLSSHGISLLVLGGGLYTVGVIFFILDHRIKHAHGIWHLFVVGGSVSHYTAIAAYVI
jgi:hemolysin III